MDARGAARRWASRSSSSIAVLWCRSGSSSAFLEDHEHTQLLVADELVLGTGGNEDRVAFPQINLLAFDVKRSSAVKDDVDLVVEVRLLMIGLGATRT